jgi:hypothetical protein
LLDLLLEKRVRGSYMEDREERRLERLEMKV